MHSGGSSDGDGRSVRTSLLLIRTNSAGTIEITMFRVVPAGTQPHVIGPESSKGQSADFLAYHAGTVPFVHPSGGISGDTRRTGASAAR